MRLDPEVDKQFRAKVVATRFPAGRFKGRWMGKIKTLLIVIFSFLQVYSQSTSVEALRATLPNGDGKERIIALQELVNRVEMKTPQDALLLATEGVSLARQLGDKEKEAAFLSSSAFCYGQMGDFTLALKYGRESLELSKQIGNKNRMARAHNTMGITYTFMGAYSQALEQHLESLRLNEELSLETSSVKTLNNIGIVYHNMGQYEKAIDYYNQVLKRLSKEPFSSTFILIKLNIGFAEYKLGRIADALKNHLEALDLISKTDNKSMIAYAYLNLGMTYTDLKEFDKARHYLRLSLEEYGKQDQKHARVQVLNAQGRLYMLTGDLAQAIPCTLEAAELAKKINAKKDLIISYDLLSNLYNQKRNINESYKYFKLFSETKDSINNIQESNKISEIAAKIVTLKKDSEIESLKKEQLISSLKIEKNRMMFFISVVSMAVIIFILIVYNNKIRNNKKILEQANLELGRLNTELKEKINEIRTLTGLLPICAQCKKIRNDEGYWEQLEGYISEHTAATFTHGICPGCAEELYPDTVQRIRARATEVS